jgi:hypothetical protein
MGRVLDIAPNIMLGIKVDNYGYKKSNTQYYIYNHGSQNFGKYQYPP